MTETLKIKKLNPNAKLPQYQHLGDAGADISASEPRVIRPRELVKVPTGLAFGIPKGWELQFRPRSGLSCNLILLANSPATVDAGYRGEVFIPLWNAGEDAYFVEVGDRIAQMIVSELSPRKPFELVEDFEDTTDRGTNGFGSTGR